VTGQSIVIVVDNDQFNSCEMVACWHILERSCDNNNNNNNTAARSTPVCHAMRLRNGQEIKSELMKYVKQHGLKACSVVTCVGSLQGAHLRLANADSGNHKGANQQVCLK
jgi:hypothetical protein